MTLTYQSIRKLNADGFNDFHNHSLVRNLFPFSFSFFYNLLNLNMTRDSHNLNREENDTHQPTIYADRQYFLFLSIGNTTDNTNDFTSLSSDTIQPFKRYSTVIFLVRHLSSPILCSDSLITQFMLSKIIRIPVGQHVTHIWSL